MGIIFYFSAQPSDESIESTNIVVNVLYKMCNVFSINNFDVQAFSDKYFTIIRKIAHFTEFLVLGVLMYSNLKEYRVNKYLYLSMLLSIIYAISDEVHQIFVEGRYCSIKDILIDSCGAVSGIILIHLISKKCLKTKRQ